jgi:hypothetical protein
MYTEAGGKLWIRKPSAAPAVSAAKTPAWLRSRSKAMTEKASALIAQTPAARPSMPSEKLTTFITPTSATTVIGPPASPKLSAPMNGSVMFVTSTPETTGITAAPTWPASLTPGGRSKRSSSAPTSAITIAPARIPWKRSSVAPPKSRKTAEEISTPPSMAKPPSSGVDPAPSPRSLG